jgi:hypothetical protein
MKTYVGITKTYIGIMKTYVGIMKKYHCLNALANTIDEQCISTLNSSLP